MISSLVLTRLLFPEAFGLMALLSIFTIGAALFSDVGVGPSIQRSPRGDDQVFLDTAWTVQIIRGIALTLVCMSLGPVAAWLYDPQLLLMLPVAGLSLLIAGFSPTRVDTAYRHLAVGRLTQLELASQALSLIANIALAVAMKSPWALVWGTVASAAIRLALLNWFLPGHSNKLQWDRAAIHEIFHFGKWIFVSTIFAFLALQGDKAILGNYLTLDSLGIYNVGSNLAGLAPGVLGLVVSRIMIPMYRERPPGANEQNFRNVRRARFFITGFALLLQFGVALGGIWLVTVLYDPRFASAGAVVVAIACMNVPQLIGITYDQASLAAGDSRSMFLLTFLRATTQTLFFFVGGTIAGLPGAFLGVWIAQVVVHPLVALVARKHRVWDPLHDAVFFSTSVALTGIVMWLHGNDLAALTSFWT